MKKFFLFFILAYVLSNVALFAQQVRELAPDVYTYSDTLKAYVFSPSKQAGKKSPAIVLFHGGGWYAGNASWTFSFARRMANNGMVAIAIDYRLSDNPGITPVEAMEDGRKAIVWAKKQSKMLGVDPEKVVAYGYSAGAHIAASTAVFSGSSEFLGYNSIPSALVLVSPALSVVDDGWFRKLLGPNKRAVDYSPADHLYAGMPPSIILIGEDDTVTPLARNIVFHERMQSLGNYSVIKVYPDVGHLFTPSTESDKGQPNPDKEVQEQANKAIEQFLKDLGYIN
jgi:acetyl esterase/lipase